MGTQDRFGVIIAALEEKIPPEIIPLDIPEDRLRRAVSRVLSSVTALATKSPALKQCTASSLTKAVVICASLDLVPTLDRFTPVDIIPRRPQKGAPFEANVQISARGLVVLAQREGWSLTTGIIRKNDDYQYEQGDTPRLVHRPGLDPDPLDPRSLDPLEAAYVTARRTGMEPVFRVIGRRAILKRRDQAQTQKVWTAWPEEMVQKTAIHYGLSRHMIAIGDRLGLALRVLDEEAMSRSQPVDVPRPADPLALAMQEIDEPDAEAELAAPQARQDVAAELVDSSEEHDSETEQDEDRPADLDSERGWAQDVERESREAGLSGREE